MNECEQICYQQWVDMYNKKDKECFDLQLKLSMIEDIAKYTQEVELSIIGYKHYIERILKIIRGEQ